MSGGQRRPCALPSLRREECHSMHGKQGEECVHEELGEKRCIAELMCQREATKFYREPLRREKGGPRGSCSTLVERFAFPENEMSLPGDVRKDERERCRGIVHELAKCLSRSRRSFS